MTARLLLLALVVGCTAPEDEASSSSTTSDSSTTITPTTTGEPPPEFWLPLACGTVATVGQGNNSEFSHTGLSRYAFDILLALDTPVYAMADGTVRHIYDLNDPGERCHDGGGEACFAFANLVVLLHADGTTTLYKHLDTVAVVVGAQVARGGLLGYSGSTGWSTRPHLHVMRMSDCGETQCQSLPLQFVDAGVPATGEQVTSHNCP